MIDEYKKAGIEPDDVWPQSIDLRDVLYWIANEPHFGKQAVFLDGGPIPHPDPLPFLQDLADRGIRIVAPPMPMLLSESKGTIVPSKYALAAKEAGLEMISWTTERSGRIAEDVRRGGDPFYYQTTLDALENDGDILTTIDVLARQVGIIGLFSDWPGTTTYYANCVGLD
jgi:glycerophosphoryl diester phosphodiesterase